MSSGAPRKHHFVPQFYLRAFANAKDQVRVSDLKSGRSFVAHTSNVFAQRDYYTVSSVDAEDDHRLIEQGVYGQMDALASETFQRLLAGEFPLSAEDRSHFAAFMAAQVTRGPAFEALFGELSDQVARRVLKEAADRPPAYWAALRERWKADPVGPEPPKPMTEAERAALRAGTAFRIQTSRESLVESRFDLLEQLWFLFSGMTWHLIEFERPCLFTSEHPISYWSRHRPAAGLRGIGPLYADEVHMVLSPTAALVLVHKHERYKPFDLAPEEGRYVGDTRSARRLNVHTLAYMPNGRMLSSPDVSQHPLPVVPGDAMAGVVVGVPPLPNL